MTTLDLIDEVRDLAREVIFLIDEVRDLTREVVASNYGMCEVTEEA